MSIEHFISLIDRKTIDEALSLSWKEYSRRHPWRKRATEWESARSFLEEFALASEKDQLAVDEILERRTLRWTMNRCSPRLFFMYQVINQVPDLRERCVSYTPQSLNDLNLVQAVAAEAFVRGEIAHPMFFSVLRFCEGLALEDAMKLKKARYRVVREALKSWVPSMPPFRWLSDDYFGEGYACLNLVETKSVVRFLELAWASSWAAPHLSDWVRGDVGLSSTDTPTIRHSDAAREVLRWFEKRDTKGMSLVSYVGSL